MRKSALLLVVLGVCSFALLQLLLLQVWRPQLSHRIWIVPAAQEIQRFSEGDIVFYGCLENVVTVQWGGRFGNLFMGYISALGVAQRHNMTLILPGPIAGPLRDAFEDVGAPSMEEYLQGRTGIDGQPCSLLLHEEMVYEKERRWKVKEKMPNLQGVGPVVIRRYILYEKYIAPIASSLRTRLRFVPILREHVQNILRPAGEEVAKAAGTGLEDVVYIGVHSRRTDYFAFLKRVRIAHLANESYFVRAVDWLLQTLERERTASEPGATPAPPPLSVAVLVASDDMDWVNTKLIPVLERDVNRRNNATVRAFAAGGGSEADVLKDLAVLSACNHTVFTYGTYAMTAALLAGGHTVLYDVHQVGHHTLRMARQLQNWTIMD